MATNLREVDIRSICQLAHTTKGNVRAILKSESKDFEITKSLLNILYNVRVIGSIPITKPQRRYLDSQEDDIQFLLNVKVPLPRLQSRLFANPKLTIFIAGIACSHLSTSFYQLKDIGNS